MRLSVNLINMNMGVVYENLDRFEEALFHAKSQTTYLAMRGETHLMTEESASLFHNMAGIYLKQGGWSGDKKKLLRPIGIADTDRSRQRPKLEKALEFYQRSLDINAKLVKNVHPDVAHNHWGLGNVHVMLENFEKGLFHIEKAQELFVAIHGDTHPKVTDTHFCLINLHRAQGDSEKVLKNCHLSRRAPAKGCKRY